MKKELRFIAKMFQDEQGMATELFYMGWTYSNLHNFEEALKSANNALTIFQKLNFKHGINNTENLIKKIHQNMKRY